MVGPDYYRERMLNVLVHIQRHLDDPLPLDELAKVACFSPFHFHRLFRGLVGETVAGHVRRLRLERAAMRLKPGGGDDSVTQIAFEAGYESLEAFSRAFKALFGASPSEYRARYAAVAELEAAAPSGVHFAPDGKAPNFEPRLTGGDTMEVSIETLEPIRVAFTRHIGPYSECGEAWNRLMMWAGPKGLIGPRTVILGGSYDDPDVTPPDKIRYDACLTVEGDVSAEGDVGIRMVGGGRYAKATHIGPYEKLGECYQGLIGGWIPRNGHRAGSEPCLEFYRNDLRDTPPEQLRTDVYVPLEE